jgi:cytoskeletal protein CcmA (bactofilin family)
MFSKKNSKPQSIATLIGADTIVRGDVAFSGGLHLEGRVVGDVTGDESRSVLTVGEQGVIEGSVRLGQLVLNGTITGDVQVSQRAELGPTARVEGNLRYSVLEMAGGARVNGRLVHEVTGRQALPAPEAGGIHPEVDVDDASPVR